MPISIFRGMAGTKRLNNYLDVLEQEHVSFHSIYHYPKATHFKKIEYGVPFNGMISRFVAQFRIFNRLFKIKQNNKKNILYFYNYPSILNIHILLFARLIGYKIIIDVVEDYFKFNTYNSRASRLKYFTARIFIKRIKYIADGIIVISSHLDNLMKKFSNGKCLIISIPITIDLEEFDDKIDQNINNKTNRNVIFYGGSFGQKDGLEFLLTAFDLVCESHYCKLIITGRGSDHDMLRFYKLLDGLKNKEYVTYLGFVEREEYVKNLKEADIHCVTRTGSGFANAGFPFKLGEMLATGKPVICTKVGDIDQYLKDKESAILIEPDNIIQIANAIKLLTSDRVMARNIGKKGKSIAFNSFDNKSNTQKLLKLCEMV